MSLRVTMGMTVGSVSRAVSYNEGRVSTAAGSNGPAGTAGMRKVVLVSGSGLGRVGMSARAETGASSCESSVWQSESALVCKVVVGTGRSGLVVVTGGVPQLLLWN